MWLYYLIVLFVIWAQIEGRTIPRKALTVGINVDVSKIKKKIFILKFLTMVNPYFSPREFGLCTLYFEKRQIFHVKIHTATSV
jgi:hypothetical protein